MEGHARRAILVLAVLIGSTVSLMHNRPATAARAGRSGTCIFDHQSLRTAKGICRPHAKSYPKTVRGSVRRAIYDAALTFGMPYSVLFKIARCESNLNPGAAYAGHYGLFQFLPQTFTSGSGGMRVETGITASTYWNALDASYVAGYLFVTGEAREWSCMQMPPG